tara:strand:- start:644 stop:1384 length:741 start_codon:yes stop_codon:yes gene_type:complete
MWDEGVKPPLHLVFQRVSNPDDPIENYPYGVNTDFVFVNKLVDHPSKEYIDTECMRQIDEQGDQQNHETNVKGAMTDWYMAHKPGFKELTAIAVEFSRQAFPWITHPMGWDTWGNRYTSGQYAKSHWHRPAQISWTYYPKVDDDHPGLYFPDMATENGVPGITVIPEDGDLLMWEGLIRHQVHTKEFKNPRYVIAGNMFFEYREVDDEFRLGHHEYANKKNRDEMKEKLAKNENAAKSVFSTSEME